MSLRRTTLVEAKQLHQTTSMQQPPVPQANTYMTTTSWQALIIVMIALVCLPHCTLATPKQWVQGPCKLVDIWQQQHARALI